MSPNNTINPRIDCPYKVKSKVNYWYKIEAYPFNVPKPRERRERERERERVCVCVVSIALLTMLLKLTIQSSQVL